MERNMYAVKVFYTNERDDLLKAVNLMGIDVPEEYWRRKLVWDDLFVIDVERKTIRLILDYEEKRAMVHTGMRVVWAETFIKEVEEGTKPERIWKQIYRQDDTLAYEGFTEARRPHGAGKAFYPDGSTYQEGLFGEKGLLSGVEYYDNGQVRFDGIFKYHSGYGPNYPIYGRCYYRDGKLMYDGQIKVSFVGSLGYPHVDEPEDYGTVAPGDRPRY